MDNVFFKGVALPIHHKVEMVKTEVVSVSVPVVASVPVPAPVVTAPVLTIVESKPELISELVEETVVVVSVESTIVEESEAFVAKTKPKKNKA